MKPAYELCIAPGEEAPGHSALSKSALLASSTLGSTHWLTASSSQVVTASLTCLECACTQLTAECACICIITKPTGSEAAQAPAGVPMTSRCLHAAWSSIIHSTVLHNPRKTHNGAVVSGRPLMREVTPAVNVFALQMQRSPPSWIAPDCAGWLGAHVRLHTHVCACA